MLVFPTEHEENMFMLHSTGSVIVSLMRKVHC